LARVVAQYQNELPRFFKRYQIQPVWRADRPARGRFREFYQCDIDSVGSTSPIVEAEILGAVTDVLTALGFGDFRIRLNHRGALAAVLRVIGIPSTLQTKVLVIMDKFDKVGFDGVTRELRECGVDEAATHGVRQLLGGVAHNSPVQDALAFLRRFLDKDPTGSQAVEELRALANLAAGTAAAERIQIDASLARGLSYYTGAIMEIAVEGIGSLGGGGRYDNLVGMFLGRDIPACGFSLGLERIIVLMTERSMFPAEVAGGGVDILVTLWNDESRADSVALAAKLRQGGLRVDLYPEADKLGKQFKYASSRNAPFVAILGDDERARGDVAVKDLRSGEQTAMPQDQVAGFVAANRKPRT
jgi:histidyl-tRNA synthetase